MSSKASLTLAVRRDGRRILIESPHWTVAHDADAGGAVVEMRVRHGSNRNLLRAPILAAVDQWSEGRAESPQLLIEESGASVDLTCCGRLADAAGAPGPVEYVHRIHYTAYAAQHSLTLAFLERVPVRRLCALTLAAASGLNTYSYGSTDYDKVKPRYLHIIGPHYDDVWASLPTEPGTVQEDARRPWQVTLMAEGVEGIQWCGDSREYDWNCVCGAEGAGRFRLVREPGGAALELCPIDQADAVPVSGTLRFGWTLILPNVPENGRRKFYEVVTGTSPFPEGAQMEAWASQGVDVVRIHQDADYQGQTEDYWHDGAYPPYPPAKMKELDHFIRDCHRLGMKVLPYFCGWILNTLTPAFAAHVRDWYVPSRPNGQLRYHPSPGAGAYGAFVCPDSGWGQFLDEYIRTCVDRIGFDGYYLDYGSPGPCYNFNHLPGAHNGIDALMGMLIRHRQWLGDDRLLIAHNGGTCMWLLHNNVADQVVTLEEGLRGGGPLAALDDYPPYVDYMPAASVQLVPNVFYPGAGEPPRQRLYRGIAHAALLGALPYAYAFHERSAWAYESWAEAVHDPRGLFAAYKQFSAHDWSAYRFFSARSGAARAANPAVGAALCARQGQAVAVIANMADQEMPAGRATIQPRLAEQYRLPASVDYAALGPFEVRLILL
jgi:hypothetical protein